MVLRGAGVAVLQLNFFLIFFFYSTASREKRRARKRKRNEIQNLFPGSIG
jgi:hypothetical protein